MSLISAAAPYRRDQPRERVPVVLPLVEVTVDQDGYLTVTLDCEPYSADGALTRDDLKKLLEGIAADLGTPVRVEVHETDQSTFTDIITPTPRFVEPAPVTSTALASAFGISGSGFTAGEQVDVCVVVAQQVADTDGTTHLRLPPPLLADHPQVVLVGRTSGTVALSQGTGEDTGEGAA